LNRRTRRKSMTVRSMQGSYVKFAGKPFAGGAT
jgi:hypothetical protein